MTLVLEQVSLTLEGRPLFTNLSGQVNGGDVLAIMGPSGCGKSSLLNIICGTLTPAFRYQGRVLLLGKSLGSLPPHRRQVGIQFQDHLLFPHMTVAGNLSFGLPSHYQGRQRQERIERALVDCGLPGFGDHDPGSLSGGQKARVSLMRTLLSEPRALLLDEPFSQLDRSLRGQFRDFVFQQIGQRKIPGLMVTHDAQDASGCSQVIEMG